MKELNLTQDQLETLYSNFKKVHKKLEEVLLTIANSEKDGIALGELNKTLGFSDFIGGRCVSALLLVGFIELEEEWNSRKCTITESGRAMKELILNKKK